MGPCLMSSDARMASWAATPMPSSAPSVVPLAYTQPSFIKVSMGSFSKSCSLSLFFSHTISIWLCNTTDFRFSMPRVAGFLINTFPTSSCVVSRRCFFPKSSKYSMIFSSFFEGRGMARISLKYVQMEDGSNSIKCSFMLFYFDGSKLIKS